MKEPKCTPTTSRPAYWVFLSLIFCDALLIGLHGWHVSHSAYVRNFALSAYEHPLYSLLDIFNLDAEGTAAAWYSSAKLLLIGLFSISIYWMRREYMGRLGALWFLMGLTFIALSLDESASIHERSAGIIMSFKEAEWLRASLLRGDDLKDSFAWVVLFSPLIAGLLLMFAWAFVNELSCTRIALVVSLLGIGCFAASVLLEASIYLAPDVKDWEESFMSLYIILTSVEELAEMLGATLILSALTLHWIIVFRETFVATKHEAESYA